MSRVLNETQTRGREKSLDKRVRNWGPHERVRVCPTLRGHHRVEEPQEKELQNTACTEFLGV